MWIKGPLEAEALGCREALSWLKNQGVQRDMVESDSSVLVQAVHNPCTNQSYTGLIMEDCHFLLEELPECTLVFVKRLANQETHSLPRAVGSLPDSPNVITSFPSIQ